MKHELLLGYHHLFLKEPCMRHWKKDGKAYRSTSLRPSSLWELTKQLTPSLLRCHCCCRAVHSSGTTTPSGCVPSCQECDQGRSEGHRRTHNSTSNGLCSIGAGVVLSSKPGGLKGSTYICTFLGIFYKVLQTVPPPPVQRWPGRNVVWLDNG